MDCTSREQSARDESTSSYIDHTRLKADDIDRRVALDRGTIAELVSIVGSPALHPA
jgi:hypothetical protein